MTIAEKKVFKNQDLVLKVSPNVDPQRFDINKYEAFLDALCGEREYQKEAIKVTLRYLLGVNIITLRSWQKRITIRTRFCRKDMGL